MKRLTILLILAYGLPLYGQQTMGLFFNDEKSLNGYTLFSNNKNTYLVDNCGFVVNEWESEYRCNNGVYISEDGKLVRQGNVSGTGGVGGVGGTGGIVERFDWNGNLEWSYQIANDVYVTHHDMELMPNGNILLLVWERLSPERALAEGRTTTGECYNELILEIKPVNSDQIEIVWQWSAIDHVIQDADAQKSNFGVVADHPELIDFNYITAELVHNKDWLHFNSIDYNEELDQIIISCRNTSEVYVIDHSTTTEEATSGSGGQYGKGGDILYRYGNPEAYDHGSVTNNRVLHQPHDVGWINVGQFKNEFIIFNNKYLTNNRSRIQIWNNPSANGSYTFSSDNLFGDDGLLWSYDTIGFYSHIMSSVQYLPNGNLLTTEGNSGEISEITVDKEKVWKYINPVNANGGPGIQGGTPQFNSLFRSSRYPADFVGFVDIDLTPTEPVELLPDDIGCEIYGLSSIEDFDFYQAQDQFYAIQDLLIWKGDHIPKGTISIYNTMGQICMQFNIRSFGDQIDISSLNLGMYIIGSDKLKSQMILRI